MNVRIMEAVIVAVCNVHVHGVAAARDGKQDVAACSDIGESCTSCDVRRRDLDDLMHV